MKSHAVTVLIVLAALACYGAGYDGAGLAMVFAAAGVELWLWIREIQAPRGHRLPHSLGLRGSPVQRR